jgi:hypothetical protein
VPWGTIPENLLLSSAASVSGGIAVLKGIVLLKRKQGLTREEFLDYYETRHVPLVRTLLPSIGGYTRNYLDLTPVASGGAVGAELPGDPPDFDVITELWFAGKPEYEKFLSALADPEVARRLRQDEETFLDRSTMRMFSVLEYGGPAVSAAAGT